MFRLHLVLTSFGRTSNWPNTDDTCNVLWAKGKGMTDFQIHFTQTSTDDSISHFKFRIPSRFVYAVTHSTTSQTKFLAVARTHQCNVTCNVDFIQNLYQYILRSLNARHSQLRSLHSMHQPNSNARPYCWVVYRWCAAHYCRH